MSQYTLAKSQCRGYTNTQRRDGISRDFLPCKQPSSWMLCLKLEAQYEKLAKQQEKYLGSQEGKGITVIHVIHSPSSLCLWLKPHMFLVSLRNTCSFSFPQHWLNIDWNQCRVNIIPNHKTFPSVKYDQSFIRLCSETISSFEIGTELIKAELILCSFSFTKQNLSW